MKFAPPVTIHPHPPGRHRHAGMTDDFPRPSGSVLRSVTPGVLVVGRFTDPDGNLVGVAA
ncbi:hypothetical protein GCM10009850_075170 [Nonomuraea monospora]|uniref:Uncharacterized protein n=1 Tax=Nonomuraea monospora TaxID=568818 RepID=A0ABN3CRH2_9ACTN